MTNQLQVPVPTITPEASMVIALFNAQVTGQVRQVTRQLADKLEHKQSALELELEFYALSLCSCLFGLVCEALDEDIELKPGQAGQIQDKLKRLAINLMVNELQDKQPQPSEN